MILAAWEQTETVSRWATWAEEQGARWPDDIANPTAQETGALLGQAARGG